MIFDLLLAKGIAKHSDQCSYCADKYWVQTDWYSRQQKSPHIDKGSIKSHAFFCRLPFFFKIIFFKKLFHEHYQSVKEGGSKSEHSVGPDLGPHHLHRLSADNKSCH